MKISVLAVGKMGDRRIGGLCKEYRERLAHHVQVDEIEVSKVKRSDPASIMEKEAKNLRAATPKGALSVALTEEGKQLRSVELAQAVNRWMVEGRKEIAFYIGGAHGLAPGLKKDAQRRWSLSPMTFPHDMARMLLWEQLYRAMTIIRNEPYHK